MYNEKIVDLLSGEELIRDYTSAEIEEVEKEKLEIAARIAKRAEKQNAQKAIFEKLGLSEEEIAVLLG